MLSESIRFKFCLQFISLFLLSSCQNAMVELLAISQSKMGPQITVVGFPASGTTRKNVSSLQLLADGLQSGDKVQVFSDAACNTEILNGVATSSSMNFTLVLSSDGSYQFFIKAKNISGDISSCSGGTFTYVLDTVPPTGLSFSLVAPSLSPSNLSMPTIRISNTVVGDTAKIFLGSTCSGSAVANVSATAATSDVITTSLSDGVLNFYASVTDLAGNSTACLSTGLSYTLDTVAPAAPTGLSLQLPIYSPSRIQSPTILVSGVTSGHTIKLFNGAGCVSMVVSAVASTNSINLVSSSLPEGTYSFYAKAMNPAGNISTCSTSTVSYTVNLMPVQTPTITLRSDIDNPGYNLTPVFNVANLQTAYTVKLYTDACLSELASTFTAAAAGTSGTITPLSSLISGNHNFYIRSTDTNGEISPCSAVANYKVQLWEQKNYLKSQVVTAHDQYGTSVSASGLTLAVGSPQYIDTTLGTSGIGRVFIYSLPLTGASSDLIQTIVRPGTGTGDKFGNSVSLSGNTLAIGAYSENANGNTDSGAVYIYTRASSVSSFGFQQKITATNSHANDYFGWAVSLDGDRLVVGAPNESSGSTGISATTNVNTSAVNRGAVYVYSLSGASWALQAYIKSSNGFGPDLFGYSVALSGNNLLVGAYAEGISAAGIFNSMNMPAQNATANNSGAVYVYLFTSPAGGGGTGWTEEAYIKAPNNSSGNNFGSAVAISGSTAVVGAENESSNFNTIVNSSGVFPTASTGASGSGAAYVYTRSASGAWSNQAYLKPSNNTAYYDFGNNVAISQDTIVVSAPYEKSIQNTINNGPLASSNTSGTQVGAAYIFNRSVANQWSQKAYLKSLNAHSNDSFGTGLAIFGDMVFVGAPEQAASSLVDANYLTTSAGAVYYMRLNKGP